jgi:hypothetical protein
MAGCVLSRVWRSLRRMMYAVWGLGRLSILFYAAVSLSVCFVDLPGLGPFLGDAPAIDRRGNEVTAETERHGTAGLRAKTVSGLKPAHHWFATTLLTARSNHYLVGFKGAATTGSC